MREAVRWDLESLGRGKSLKVAAADTVWRERERRGVLGTWVCGLTAEGMKEVPGCT